MGKWLFMSGVVAFSLSASVTAQAQSAKAPCGSFQKLPDGKWTALKAIKIEHGNETAILNQGMVIAPGTRVASVDLYAALQKSCH